MSIMLCLCSVPCRSSRFGHFLLLLCGNGVRSVSSMIDSFSSLSSFLVNRLKKVAFGVL